jgi:hypothetical protein
LFTFGSPSTCTTVLHFVTTKKIAKEKAGHAQSILPELTWLTSLPGKKPPLRWILCNFRFRMRRTYFRTGLRSRDFLSRD